MDRRVSFKDGTKPPKNSELKSKLNPTRESTQLNILRGDDTILPNKTQEVEKEPGKKVDARKMWTKVREGIISLTEQVYTNDPPEQFRTRKGTPFLGMHWDSKSGKMAELTNSEPSDLTRMSPAELQKAIIDKKYGDGVEIKEPVNRSSESFNKYAYVFINLKKDKVWLERESVATILKDDYSKIASHKDLEMDGKTLSLRPPKPGDATVIIYHKGDVYSGDKDDILHAGILSVNGKVSSKWELGPIVEHDIAAVPPDYGENWTIFRGSLNGRRMTSLD